MGLPSRKKVWRAEPSTNFESLEFLTTLGIIIGGGGATGEGSFVFPEFALEPEAGMAEQGPVEESGDGVVAHHNRIGAEFQVDELNHLSSVRRLEMYSRNMERYGTDHRFQEQESELLQLPVKIRSHIWSMLETPGLLNLRATCRQNRQDVDFVVGLDIWLNMMKPGTPEILEDLRAVKVTRMQVVAGSDTFGRFKIQSMFNTFGLTDLNVGPLVPINSYRLYNLVTSLPSIKKLSFHMSDGSSDESRMMLHTLMNVGEEAAPINNSILLEQDSEETVDGFSVKEVTCMLSILNITSPKLSHMAVELKQATWTLLWSLAFRRKINVNDLTETSDMIPTQNLLGLRLAMPRISDELRETWLRFLAEQTSLQSVTADLGSVFWGRYALMLRKCGAGLKEVSLIHLTDNDGQWRLPMDWGVFERCTQIVTLDVDGDTIRQLPTTSDRMNPSLNTMNLEKLPVNKLESFLFTHLSFFNSDIELMKSKSWARKLTNGILMYCRAERSLLRPIFFQKAPLRKNCSLHALKSCSHLFKSSLDSIVSRQPPSSVPSSQISISAMSNDPNVSILVKVLIKMYQLFLSILKYQDILYAIGFAIWYIVT